MWIAMVIPVSGMKAELGNLTVSITNIRSDSGILRMAIYDDPDQFPDNPASTYILNKLDIKDSMLSIVIPDLPAGIYAIALLDDLDGDDEMDYTLLHFPKEGFGFSNNIKPGLRRPPYKKCSFRIEEGENQISIAIQYFREK